MSYSASRLKNEDGGNCFESPATIMFLALEIAATHSSVGSWLASSKITASKYMLFPDNNFETLTGLIIIHGFNFNNKLGMFLNNFLKAYCLRCFLASCLRIPTSENFASEL